MDTRCDHNEKLCVLQRQANADGVCPGPRCDFWSEDGCLLASLGLSLQRTRVEAHPVLAHWRISPSSSH
jgi:hypothetical protein